MNVRRLFPPSVAVFSLLGIFLFAAAVSEAQINAPPSSVTSPGFGGRPINGTAPSVTSVGPRGYIPKTGIPSHPITGNGDGHHNHRRNGGYYTPYLYAYPVPYAADPYAYSDAPDPGNDDADYQGGPTVFDRRGSGARSYVPPLENVPAAHNAQQADPVDPPAPDSQQPQVQTLLIFKDGHQVELGNYAIVGSTLFDLTPGHPRRIPLADLNLDATQKQNEDRGVTFQVPPSFQGS